ncbi:MAG: penicillin acylase family protein, partial [Actinomycetota bacterium]|nr:penicillin acylase family protein [Actinomycetota bacterium]
MNPARALFGLVLGRRHPTVSGTIEVRGIEGPVLIRRDRVGIPCIEAHDDHDAWFGLGFCQGQDRAWQLEALLRVVRGTLAALIGKDGLPVDRVARRIGWHRSAQSQLGVLGDSERAVIEAFAAGVTEGARRGAARRAHEFALLRSAPTPYEAADVLGISKLMAFVLSSNWDVELARLVILSRDGPGALACVDPAYREWAGLFSPEPAGATAALHRLAEDIGALTSLTGMGGGSNNWVIAPARTASGLPIVASDPHLEPILPNHWYLAHVRTPRWAVAGAALAGTPTFAAAHNGNVAWGITAGLIDNTDLFIEEVGPDGRSVRGPDGFVACTVRPEVIEVKGSPSVEESVLLTPRGPVVGAALEMERWAISMSATWLEARPITGLFKAPEARSSADLRAAMGHWPTLPLNLAFADTGGSIGWQLVGDTPRRRSGVGVLPLRGWDHDAGWEDDPVAFEELPRVADPEQGWIATANNKPQGNRGAWLGVDWADPYRVERIAEALEARSDWDLAGVAALQLDLESLPWRKLRDVVLAAPVGGSARLMGSLLAGWDGRVGPESPGATVFELFMAEMARRAVEAKAPQSARWALGAGFGPLTKMSSFGYRHAWLLERLLIE